jgi:tripartite-type tricarboxylate transporter receptor subunit TctC
MNRRDILKTGLASLATTTLAPLAALAQGRYPERPIRLVVPFAPGGATDVVGRLWAEKMKPLIGTVVVENKPSGGGAPGTTEVARAQPDGYTLLFGNTSTQVLLPVLMPKQTLLWLGRHRHADQSRGRTVQAADRRARHCAHPLQRLRARRC